MVALFKKHIKSFVGIDVGTSAVRVVELSKHGDQKKLESYGQLSVSLVSSSNSLRVLKKGTLMFPPRRISEMITMLLEESKIESKNSIFSIPDFSTLFTSFTLPPMEMDEIDSAVRFEARRHVPLPLSEVTLDWIITNGQPGGDKKERLEVLLAVVPNRIIEQYTEIAQFCKIELVSLEAEVFGLQRALVYDSKEVICLIDIGVQSTTCSIIDKNILRISHSFDLGGGYLTERISRSLGIDYEKAEMLKQNQGFLLGDEKELNKTLRVSIELILSQIARVVDAFYRREGKEIQRYIIAGGSGFLPGLEEYVSKSTKAKVEIAFPFKGMVYPAILEPELRKLGPSFTIATGMALKGFR